MRPAVFLDRDNTILANDGDLGAPELIRLLPGCAEGIAALRRLGFLLVVVTNQGGVARGRYGEDAVHAVHRHLEALLRERTGFDPAIDLYLHCPYHPDGAVPEFRREHPWRKPSPGMLLAAAESLMIDLPRSWMIGDAQRDISAGRAAGCRTIAVNPTGERTTDADRTVRDLVAAAAVIGDADQSGTGHAATIADGGAA